MDAEDTSGAPKMVTRQRKFTVDETDSDEEHPVVPVRQHGRPHERADEDEDVGDGPAPDSSSEEEQYEQRFSKPRKAPNVLRDYKPYKQWSKEEHSFADIHVAIKMELEVLNAAAGLQNVSATKHKDRKNIYGDWVFRRSRTSCRGVVDNSIYDCPLSKSAGCQCQAKIVESPAEIFAVILC